MGKYRELVKMAMEKGEEEEAWKVADEVMEKLCKKYPELYDDLIMDLEHLAYKIPQDQAEQIVRSMRPHGQQWSVQQVRDMLRSKGITKDCVKWYLVMNMCYNDFCDTAKQFGLQHDEEFFYCLAKDFIEDPDAKPFKVEKYFLG